jgi:hypothetical protein
MNMMTFIFIIGVVAVIFLLFHALAKQRRKKMAAYAQSQGWHFTPDKDRGMDDRHVSFKCMRRGHSRYAYNIMHGKREGRNVTAFDYHYVTGYGKSRRVHYFSALIIQSPLLLKPLYIRPENIFDRMTDFFGFNDIDFESAEFSRTFYVKAPERRWAYDVIHQRMMEYLLEAPKFHVQFDSRAIIVWRNKRFSEQDFDDAFDLVQGILSRLPEYVKKQQLEYGQADRKMN